MNKALMVIVVACAVAGIAKAEHFQCGDGRCKTIADEDNLTFRNDPHTFIASVTWNRNLILSGQDGRRATIDFSGNEVVYGGDLPVDDAAKVFFDAVMQYSKTQDCPKP